MLAAGALGLGALAALPAAASAAAPPAHPAAHSAAAAASTVTYTQTLPTPLTPGASPAAGSATIQNSATGPTYAHVRVDFVISGIPALKANQVTITYGSGSMTGTVPLTDGPNGTITGYFGPQTGFQVGPGYNQMTPLQVSLSNNAPGGTLTVVGNVDDLSTTPPTSLAMQSSMITVPALTYTQMPPTMITAGSATAAMGTATLNDPGNGPSYSNVRVDFVLSGIPGLKAAQVHITYPTTGPSSTGNIPLTDGPNGTITGYFGPQTGFPVSPPLRHHDEPEHRDRQWRSGRHPDHRRRGR